MAISLKGRRALVTGGSRGIGRATVLALAEAGAEVMTCHRQPGGHAESLRRELAALPGTHHVVRADLSDPGQAGQLARCAADAFGHLDVLVNNAGVIHQVPYPGLTPGEWQRTVATGLTAPYLLVQQCLPLLRPGASVIGIGSRAVDIGVPGRAHYTAVKAALTGLTRSLARELGPRGIRVNMIAPGIVETETWRELPDEQQEAMRRRYADLIALGRTGRPDEVAHAVLWLASDLARYVTGCTVAVDGGLC
ncbi:SDR family NAD(P)-dependent oxidoreductase [Streptomyces morookaense]|uniref:SDR family NAD(P)-dependent oxidoreductase n=1 Tax=Streptomyces morookaense TaxID=1970 RepID=UPI0033FA21D8